MTRVRFAPPVDRPARYTGSRGLLALSVILWLVGAALGFLVGWSQLVTSVSLAVALVAMLIAVPSRSIRGLSAVTAIAIGFTLGPINTSQALIFAGACIASAVCIIGLIRGEKTTEGPVSAFSVIAGLMYFAVVLLATFLNAEAVAVYSPLLTVVVPGFLILLLARRFTVEDARVFTRGFIVFALAQVVVAAVDFVGVSVPILGYNVLGGQRLINPLFGSNTFRAQGLAGHPIVMALIIIVAMVFIWQNLAKLSRLIRVFTFAVLTWGLILSGTRSALVAVLIGLCLLIIFSGRTFTARLRNLIIVAIVVAAASNSKLVRAYVSDLVVGLSESGSFTHRAAAFDSFLPLFHARSGFTLWFGSGVASESYWFDRGFLQHDGFDIIDNQFVTTFVVTGILGLLLLAIISARTMVVSSPTVLAATGLLLVMANSFDMLRWLGAGLVFFSLIGMADNQLFRRRPPGVAKSSAFEPNAAGIRLRQGSGKPRLISQK